MLLITSSILIGLLWALLEDSDMPLVVQASILLAAYVSQAHLAWPVRRHSLPDTTFTSVGLALWIPIYLSGSEVRAEWLDSSGDARFAWLWVWHVTVLVICPLVMLAGLIRGFMYAIPSWAGRLRHQASNREE